jgi:hypothetical protein
VPNAERCCHRLARPAGSRTSPQRGSAAAAVSRSGRLPRRRRRLYLCPLASIAAADGNVLRPGRLDGAVVAARSRGSARGNRRVSPHCWRSGRRSMALSPTTWAMAYWFISATRKDMRTTPSGRCEQGWARSTLSVASMSNPSSSKRTSGSRLGWCDRRSRD